MRDAILLRIGFGTHIERGFLGLEVSNARLDALLDGMPGEVFGNAGGDGARNLRWIELVSGRQ